jgi:acetyl esterase
MPLDPQAQAILDVMGGLLDLTSLTPQQARDQMAAMRPDLPVEPVARVEDLSAAGPAGDIPLRLYAPASDTPLPVLVYFHGGGWVIGDIESHDPTCRSLANVAGCAVISVDYRLAPEAKFPAAAEDAYAATVWVRDNAARLGLDPSRLAVGGDSAGGNLAAVVSLMARDRGAPPIDFQLLVYPVTDHSYETASYVENATGYLLTRESMEWFWNHYISSPEDSTNPYASPLRATDLAGLPPALVITAEFDPLRDEGEAYATRLREAGVPTTCTRYDGMIHGFFGMGAAIERANDAVAEAATALRAAFGMPALAPVS